MDNSLAPYPTSAFIAPFLKKKKTHSFLYEYAVPNASAAIAHKKYVKPPGINAVSPPILNYRTTNCLLRVALATPVIMFLLSAKTHVPIQGFS